MTAPDAILGSSSMAFGSPAFKAKLEDSKRRLEEGYAYALSAKKQRTIRVLPPHLLPPPIPGRHAPPTTSSVKQTTITHKIKKITKLSHPRPQPHQNRKKVPAVLRLHSPLPSFPRNNNRNLPLQAPTKPPSQSNYNHATKAPVVVHSSTLKRNLHPSPSSTKPAAVNQHRTSSISTTAAVSTLPSNSNTKISPEKIPSREAWDAATHP